MTQHYAQLLVLGSLNDCIVAQQTAGLLLCCLAAGILGCLAPGRPLGCAAAWQPWRPWGQGVLAWSLSGWAAVRLGGLVAWRLGGLAALLLGHLAHWLG